MLVKIAPCIVQDMRNADNGAQYITLIEPHGGTYNVTSRPHDREHPLNAAAILKPFADAFQLADITAEIGGHISREGKQYLNLYSIEAKPHQNGNGSQPAAKQS